MNTKRLLVAALVVGGRARGGGVRGGAQPTAVAAEDRRHLDIQLARGG
jgi:hypothetical protein